MTVLQEILKWSKYLPAWQSDLIRRLVTKSELGESDLQDVYAILKSQHEIIDPINRAAIPLTAAQIPTDTSSTERVVLRAIKGMKNVNAIAENQTLPFVNLGMTVVYGDNGSGKSGYSRVLKKACRARDQSESILPNAMLPKSKTGVATALFEVTVGENDSDLSWIDGDSPPKELSTIAIFDAHCARAYLDKEDDFSYIPYGLDVFEGMSSMFSKLKTLVETELETCSVDLEQFAHLIGNTKVGSLVSKITHNTSPKQLEEMALLNEEEQAKHAFLEAALKESDPLERAKLLQLQSARFTQLANRLHEKCERLGRTTVEKLKQELEHRDSARAAADLAVARMREGDDLLPATGSDPWRALFDAAKAFLFESDSNQSFSEISPSALCPLCQEPLNAGAARLRRFNQFISADTERNRNETELLFNKSISLIEEFDESLSFDETLFSELSEQHQELANDLREFQSVLTKRKIDTLDAAKNNHWDPVLSDLSSPESRLRDVIKVLNEKIAVLREVADVEKRRAMNSEFQELEARKQLSKCLPSMLKAIEQLVLRHKLNQCKKALNTTELSKKTSEISAKVVSVELADKLNHEFLFLGVGHLRVQAKSRTAKGQPLHKLVLNLPQTRTPAEILSEGEQRAIAIGSLLAEVNLGDNPGGIIFDDPVSSLDHRRREKVAHRLVSEAKKRQVIVFTHDITFLCMLREAAEKQAVEILLQSLNRTSEGFGVVYPELPFEGLNVKKRIGTLRDMLQSAEKLHRKGEEVEYKKLAVEIYFKLRLSWERAVEELLFNESVVRFRRSIETNRLKMVVVEDDDYFEVDEGMSKCSMYAHDRALELGTELPEPAQIKEDISKLDKWRAKLDARNKKTNQDRKARKSSSG